MLAVALTIGKEIYIAYVGYDLVQNGLGIAVMTAAAIGMVLVGLMLFGALSQIRRGWKIALAVVALPILGLTFLAGGWTVMHLCLAPPYPQGSPEKKAVGVFRHYLYDHGFDTQYLDTHYAPFVNSGNGIWGVGYAYDTCNIFGGKRGWGYPNVPTLDMEKDTFRIVNVATYQHGHPLNGFRRKSAGAVPKP